MFLSRERTRCENESCKTTLRVRAVDRLCRKMWRKIFSFGESAWRHLLSSNLNSTKVSEISNFHNSSFHSALIGNSMFTVVSIECGHLDY